MKITNIILVFLIIILLVVIFVMMIELNFFPDTNFPKVVNGTIYPLLKDFIK